jgi:hypothetical protein
MEILLALMYPAGFLAIVSTLFMYLRKQETAQRALQIAKTNLTPVKDIESGYAAVAASVKALRKAKQEEHHLLLRNWQNKYMALLPDTDPEKATHQAQIQGIKIETAAFTLDKNGMRAKNKTLTIPHDNECPVVEDGPEWTPLPHKKRDPDEEMSYNERRIQHAGAFIRAEPHTSAIVYGVATGGDIVHFDGYVHGEAVSGNTIWFVYIGKVSGLRKYVHSIATTNRSISGMRNLTEPVSKLARRKAAGDYLDPDEVRELEREAAIVKNYQEDRKKYDPTPKTEIPSSLTKVWY